MWSILGEYKQSTDGELIGFERAALVDVQTLAEPIARLHQASCSMSNGFHELVAAIFQRA